MLKASHCSKPMRIPLTEANAVSYTHLTAGGPVGFIGAGAGKIEMLFIHPAYRGQGLGRQLLEACASDHPLHSVDVNEQNPEALGFYEHMGFRVASRSPLDDAGRPWPILHLVR